VVVLGWGWESKASSFMPGLTCGDKLGLRFTYADHRYRCNYIRLFIACLILYVQFSLYITCEVVINSFGHKKNQSRSN